MTSDNVFSDWLTSLETFFDKTLYSTRRQSREVNITFSNSCSIFTLLNPCEKKSIINVWITLFSVTDWSIT